MATETSDKKEMILKALFLWNPRINLKEVTFLPGGSNSIAVRAGDQVYRFPLTAEAFAAMRREAILTEILSNEMTSEARSGIARVFIVEEENGLSFSYHRYINGKIMDTVRGETEFNTCYAGLNVEQRSGLAQEIALFFADLHSLSANIFPKEFLSDTVSEWDFTQKTDEEQSRELLLRYSGGKLDLNVFKTEISEDVAFCHNDLSGSNLLIDLESENLLAGIIDFANSGFRPRTDEFIPLYKIGRDLAVRVIGYYNQQVQNPVRMAEIDYKFLCFVAFLLEHQKKPSFFVTALIEDFVQSYFTQRT